MASISFYWLTLWLWVNWVTPTLEYFRCARTKLCSQLHYSCTIMKHKRREKKIAKRQQFFFFCLSFSLENKQVCKFELVSIAREGVIHLKMFLLHRELLLALNLLSNALLLTPDYVFFNAFSSYCNQFKNLRQHQCHNKQ